MLRKLIMLIAALGLVPALASPAGGQEAEGPAAAVIQGNVTVGDDATFDVCGNPPGTGGSVYSHEGEFNDFVMVGTFGSVGGDDADAPEAYVGPVTADDTIYACINGIVEVADNPVVSEGDIYGDEQLGTGVDDAGTFSGALLGSTLDGDIDRGGFVTAGTAAAVHFSIDYNVNSPSNNADPNDVEDLSCLGSFAVAPGAGVLPDEIAGAIACVKAEVGGS